MAGRAIPSGRELGWGAAVVAVAAAAGLAAANGSPLVVMAALALPALVLSFAAPLPVVVGAWAALLPIWSVGSLDPRVFDLVRYAGAGVIAVRTWGKLPTPPGLLSRWIAPL
ncbi:MAG TPA: hypothetical protein VGP00_05930, partial [Nocardioides sp.]|nr:hypothetical protein [Nocardioides sp.]